MAFHGDGDRLDIRHRDAGTPYRPPRASAGPSYSPPRRRLRRPRGTPCAAVAAALASRYRPDHLRRTGPGPVPQAPAAVCLPHRVPAPTRGPVHSQREDGQLREGYLTSFVNVSRIEPIKTLDDHGAILDNWIGVLSHLGLHARHLHLYGQLRIWRRDPVAGITLRYRHAGLSLGDIVLVWNAADPTYLATDLGTGLERLRWVICREPWPEIRPRPQPWHGRPRGTRRSPYGGPAPRVRHRSGAARSRQCGPPAAPLDPQRSRANRLERSSPNGPRVLGLKRVGHPWVAGRCIPA